MGNLPFAIFKDVDKTVSALDLVTSGSHGEFVDTGILAPVVANADIGFQDFTLGLLLQKVVKVVLDASIVSSWDIRHSGKQNRLGSVSLGNSVTVNCGEGGE